MLQRPRLNGADNRQIRQIICQLWHQAHRKPNAANGVRLHQAGRRIGPFLQVEGVDVGGRTRQQNEDDILRFAIRRRAAALDHILTQRRSPGQEHPTHAGPRLEEGPARQIWPFKKRLHRMGIPQKRLQEFLLVAHDFTLPPNN